ncbi:MAG: class I SAM-dependent methyltransferase [Alphaproteobacteria bacterium]|nr:class I SAM-dependent methyltransferase [Alphaproteobacteria bacterium]
MAPLIKRGMVIESEEVDGAQLGEDAPERGIVLEHPKIPFWSYPYEWPFGALKAAALTHLDIQIALLDHDIALSDASAYNVQFLGPRPIFIDTLSFRRYRENEHWVGHRQFCEQFLNPLLLRARFGVPFQDWYRGRPEGIPAEYLASFATWRHYLSWRMLSHVIMPARLQSGAGDRVMASAVKAKARGLPKRSYHATLVQLRSWIATLSIQGHGNSVWGAYAGDNTYDPEEAEQKRAMVAEFVKAVGPKQLLDLGCNTGDYSALALQSGAKSVIGLDADHGALEQAFDRATAQGLDFLPLYQDSANPSPGQGWNAKERKSLSQRCEGVDAVIALALEHHLAIGRNIPLPEVVGWIVGLAPQGLIEFVHKDDPTIRKMLALRDDVFSDYNLENFVAALERHARIIRRQQVSKSGREIFWFQGTARR